MAAKCRPTEMRAQDLTFVTQCSLDGLCHRLPLHWSAPPDIPPSPKNTTAPATSTSAGKISKTQPHGKISPTLWLGHRTNRFDLRLRLIDFSPLRSVLAQRLGWTPFDPVSIFLLHGWQITNGWNRTQTLDNLRKSRQADYTRRFGFQGGLFPTEGGSHYWLTALGQHATNGDTILVDEEHQIEVAIQYLNQLIAQSVALILDAGLISPQAWTQAVICPDGMIYDAASRMRCSSVTDTCYLPTSPDNPRPARPKKRAIRASA